MNESPGRAGNDLPLYGARVLITGGLGFVGQNLTRYLLQRFSCRITVVDNCENSSPEALGDNLHHVRFIQASVLEDAVVEMASAFDYVFHLACIQIAHSEKDPELDMAVNAGSTLRMLQHLRQHPGRLRRFVYTSSASVYGAADNLPCAEDGPTQVLSHYAATKLLGEQYTVLYHRLYNLPTAVLRYSNVYGPGQTPANAYCGVIGKALHASLYGEAFGIFGNGAHTRDYTYVTDAVRATVLAAGRADAVGGIFNVGTGQETSVNSLADTVRSLAGNLLAQHLPERTIDNIARRCMDTAKIRTALGWCPEVSLREGLAHTLAWYRASVGHSLVQ